MQRIFNDEWSESGQIWSNPFGTKPILLLDIVANRLKWPALRRVSRLASTKMGCADTAILNTNRPYSEFHDGGALTLRSTQDGQDTAPANGSEALIAFGLAPKSLKRDQPMPQVSGLIAR